MRRIESRMSLMTGLAAFAIERGWQGRRLPSSRRAWKSVRAVSEPGVAGSAGLRRQIAGTAIRSARLSRARLSVSRASVASRWRFHIEA